MASKALHRLTESQGAYVILVKDEIVLLNNHG